MPQDSSDAARQQQRRIRVALRPAQAAPTPHCPAGSCPGPLAPTQPHPPVRPAHAPPQAPLLGPPPRARACRRQHVADEHENSLLGADLDALPNDVNKLADSEVCWHQVPAGAARREGCSGKGRTQRAGRALPEDPTPSGPSKQGRRRVVAAAGRPLAEWERPHFFLSMSGMSLFSAFSTMT